MHLGFQEYLAAREIRSRSFENSVVLKELAQRFGDSWWQEVVLLLAALEERTEIERFMRFVVDTPDFAKQIDLVKQCLNETVEVSLAPFVELVERQADQNRDLWARQYAALSIIAERDRAAAIAIVSKLRNHPSPDIQSWLRNRDLTTGKKTIISQPSGYELVWIPRGSFMMGSPEKGEGRWDAEGPRHEVRVRDFYLGRYPVTNEEYGRFLKANPNVKQPTYWGDSKFNQSRQPVVGVNWYEAKQYAEWAGLRLPSEAEWEYACRAGTQTRFWSGDNEEDLAQVGWYNKNSQSRLHAVGEKEANPFGLYDMHGNVDEWCEDDWHGNYEGAPKDGKAWVDDPRVPGRVRRGGVWNDYARLCRSAYRGHWGAGVRYISFGFRLARSNP